LEAVSGPPVARRRIELVERKGIGHPDTICDSVVEAISLGLNRMYLERAGAILHYNVDKALLVAGQCRKGFGWGELTQPMELVVGDRATFEIGETRLPVEETVLTAVEEWIAAHLPHLRAGRDLRTRIVLAPGSVELRGIFADGEIVANDTGWASGYAPLSPTEELVLAVERFLNGAEFKTAFPDTGQDVKVFALRQDERLALTLAMPLLCRLVGSEGTYFERKAAILAVLAEHFRGAPFEIDWALNTLDRPGRDAAGAYLVLTGTSAEDADSGQVGRGNRANGVIAGARPGSGEAAPGKNPVAHIGKVYSVLAHRMASAIHGRCPEIPEVSVHLAALIGEPVDAPWVSVQLVLAAGITLADAEMTIRDAVSKELERLPVFRTELSLGQYPVC
jgi:S-adenosylmethionine synthetase